MILTECRYLPGQRGLAGLAICRGSVNWRLYAGLFRTMEKDQEQDNESREPS